MWQDDEDFYSEEFDPLKYIENEPIQYDDRGSEDFDEYIELDDFDDYDN